MKKSQKLLIERFQKLAGIKLSEDINYDVFDEKPIDFKSLLELGIKSSLLMGEDELMEISDAFEERGDEQSDRIASHLNSAIELMQNGYSKAAAPNLRRFQAACREALNELKKSVDEGPGQKHYTKDGKEWKGATHKMPDGTLMTQDPHNKDSEKLSHKSVDESFFTGHVDQIAQAEFGMDYDQLGPGEKEWVRDEIDNMTFEGQVNEVSTHLSEAKTPEELIKVSDELEKFINDISDDIDQEDLDKLSDVLTTVRGNIKNMLKK